MIENIAFRAGVTLIVAGCLATGACGTAGDDAAPASSPGLVAVAGAESVTVNGTSVSVPGRVEGLGKPTQGGRAGARAEGSAPPHVTFLKAGPVDGTIAGSLTVAVRNDPAVGKTLAGLDATGRTDAAAVGQPGHTTSVLRAGGHLVLKVAATEVIPGAALGYPDRVYHDYLFAGSDSGVVVSVTTDILSETEVIDYIAAITA